MPQLLTSYTTERSPEDYGCEAPSAVPAVAASSVRQAPDSRRRHYHAELFVEHSPEAVWEFFSDFRRWTMWSPVCRGCRLRDDGSELQLGSVLEIRSRVMGVTITVPVTVVEFDPPTTIAWRGQKWGIQAIHSYRFLPRNGGTLLCNDETFSGVWFPFTALMSPWYRTSKLSSKSLHGIRRELARADCS